MKYLSFLLVTIPLYSFGQAPPERHPDEIRSLYFDDEFLQRFNSPESWKKCEEVWEKMDRENRQYHQATEVEKAVLKYCDEVKESPWDAVGSACSWYCGGGLDGNYASSELAPQGDITYQAGNIHDLSYKTAWVEGVAGQGIGEYVIYEFPPENPRITEIIVVNGYVKSDKAWRNNSRVKKLLMYQNGEAFAVLNLKDTRDEQVFKFKPIGVQQRDDWEKLKQMNRWTLKFEILEVYPGDKYADTAITEIYFDGIDVH